MKRLVAMLLALLTTSAAWSHDMWLEGETFFLNAGKEVTIRLGNGHILEKSENAVEPERIETLRVASPQGEDASVSDPVTEGEWTTFRMLPESPGNYWVALATKPRKISLDAADFNAYLEHDGLPHVLKERREQAIAQRDEVEIYQKYAKAFLQVGDQSGPNFRQVLGLTIEIVPLANPYEVEPGGELPVLVLYQQRPLGGFLLHAGPAKASGKPFSVYTDAGGRASIPITSAGKWSLRGIHLFRVDRPEHSYESYWASLTFEVKAGDHR